MSEEVDLALRILDHQIVDSEGRRCGKVDDLALEGGPGERLHVAALLVGPGVWPARAGWIGRVAAAVGGKRRVRIPWTDVAGLTSAVNLRVRAEDVGLGRGDDRARRWIAKLPGA